MVPSLYLIGQDADLFEENFNKLWIHGFLHLLGGRHKLNRDYLSMQKQEIKYLTMLN